MTAVEYIKEKLLGNEYWYEDMTFDQIIEQAKEMEKEQIQDAFIFSKDPFGLSIGNSHTIKKAEDYYNTTFKSE